MARKKRPGKIDAGREREQEGNRPDVPSSDYLLDAAEVNWPHILMMYRLFEEKKPVMLYDLQKQAVYAYPYLEFRQELSERSQQSLKDQYERAVRDGKIVLFVRDNDQRRLRSFSMDAE